MTSSLAQLGSRYPFIPSQEIPVLHTRSITKNVTVDDTWSEKLFGQPTLDVWIYFNLICNTVLLPLLVVTLLVSKHTRGRRPPLLVNMCIVWILSGIFSLLLFYDGTASGEPTPSLALCTAQLSLLYGILPMWSVAVLALTYHVYIEVAGHAHHKKIPMPILVIAPYIAQISFTIAGVIAATSSDSKIQRSFFFCTLDEHPLSNAMSIFTFIICLGIILLKIQLALVFFRRWKALRNARRRLSHPAPPPQGQISVIRVLVFGVYVFAGMICNVIRLFQPRALVPYLYCAVAGLVVFLVFGTQCHIFQAWSFWKWNFFRASSQRPESDPMPTLGPLSNSSLDRDGHVPPYPNWRDTSLLSSHTMEEKSRRMTYHSLAIQQEPPPTPLPKAQLGRHFYIDQVSPGQQEARVRHHAVLEPRRLGTDTF